MFLHIIWVFSVEPPSVFLLRYQPQQSQQAVFMCGLSRGYSQLAAEANTRHRESYPGLARLPAGSAKGLLLLLFQHRPPATNEGVELRRCRPLSPQQSSLLWGVVKGSRGALARCCIIRGPIVI